MPNNNPLEAAIAGCQEVRADWMPVTQVRPFFFDDPSVVWLKYHGEQHGFKLDTSPYEFLDFIAEKGRQFEEKWTREIEPSAVSVCNEAYDVRSSEKVKETFALMQNGVPLISQPALWWAPEKIYGVPDLLIHTSWLNEKFPGLLNTSERNAFAVTLGTAGESGHYVVFDIKFTTKLEETQKAKDLASYAAQVRIYSYMVGQIQGCMPSKGFLISRDRISNPLPIDISSSLDQSLDADLTAFRNHFIDIKINGANYLPWKDAIVVSNIFNQDEQWRTAKGIIAREKVSGRDSGLLYQVGRVAKEKLASMGFPNLDSMLVADPNTIPFENCRGLGAAKSQKIRAILLANRSGSLFKPALELIPPKRHFEFYIDFEFFTNLNVNFDTQWPTLDGFEMIFMVGVGWEEEGRWVFETFVAEAENQDREHKMIGKFIDFLNDRTSGEVTNSARTAIYHWSSAEAWQANRTSDRHHYDNGHTFRNLPWVDLQKPFVNSPCGVPGALGYGLKEVGKALGKIVEGCDPGWPGDLNEGLNAMVTGWRAYEANDPLVSQEINTLKSYLEADCKALWLILKWMRS